MRPPKAWAAAVLVLPCLLGLIAGCSMRSLIYPSPGVAVGPPPPGFEEIWLTLPEGIEVRAWHFVGGDPGSGVGLLFFHGNAENLETLRWAGLPERLVDLGVPLLLVDYPGYGGSGGTPSESSLKSTAEAASAWLRQRYPEIAVVPGGWSLGAALAVHLAATEPESVAGAMLLSPWTDLAAVAEAHFPAWLVSIGLGESYDSLALAGRLEAPALVVHGSADRVIPVAQGRLLADAIAEAHWVEVPGAGHGDLLAREPVWQEIGGFVERLRAAGGV